MRPRDEDSNEPTGRKIDKFSSPSHYKMSPYSKFKNTLSKKN